MRNAFALLAALVFVAFVVAMGTIYLKQARQVQNLGFNASSIAQQNALINDTISILDKQTTLVNSDEALTIFLASAAKISYDGGGYYLKVNSESLQNKIPFSSCRFENNDSAVCKNIIQAALAQVGATASDLLITTLADAAKIDKSSIALFDASFIGGKTASYARFIKILDYYSQISNDSLVKKVNWLDYFSFSNTTPTYLDCENMSPKLWNAIALSYSLSYQNCALFFKKEPNSKIAKELNLKNFQSGDSYIVNFTINLEQNNTSLGKIALHYDIGKKKALAIEAF